MSEFSVIDLDRDGTPEVVLIVSVTEYVNSYEVLHYQDGTVYGYGFSERGFSDLKIDGTFQSSGGAGDWGFCSLTFSKDSYTIDTFTYCDSHTKADGSEAYFVNHQSVTADEFFAEADLWEAKPGITWYNYTGDNIDAMFYGS